ncbi:hypothetical protein HN011_010912 [Eciton burchellii]|nr:hypothetical protein HN011_010912 [Eciton burchellii]
MDDVLESWEQIEESGTLDKRLDALRLNAEEEIESSRSSHNANTKMIILGEDGLRSQYVPPKPTVKILKRPTGNSRGSGDGPNDDKPKQPIKSLKQREQEYAEARRRILGEEKSPQEKMTQEINKIQPKLTVPNNGNFPSNVVRMPTGPDGTRGFSVRKRNGYEADGTKELFRDELLTETFFELYFVNHHRAWIDP